jgi:hypothetical protein
MSAMTARLNRYPSIRAGLVGAILGATLSLGSVFAIASMLSEGQGSSQVAVTSGAPLDVSAALQQHLAREYGLVSDGIDFQAALQQHLAREYGLVSDGIDFHAWLRDQLIREYRSAGRSPTGFDFQAALREHQQREYRTP